MTPDHQNTIETTLQWAYARTIEWNTSIAMPQGKNYTHETLVNSPLARDLTTIANFVEGYPVEQEDIIIIFARIARALFGHTFSRHGYRFPHLFHKTPLGEMIFQAFARYYPATAWMTTAEVQRLFSVKRQTVYDWAEEGKLVPYFVNGKQVYLRQQVEQFHATWMQQKQRRPNTSIVTQP